MIVSWGYVTKLSYKERKTSFVKRKKKDAATAKNTLTFAEEEILRELLTQTKDKIIRIESSFENKTSSLKVFYRNNMTDIDRYVDGLTNGCPKMDICTEVNLNNNNEKDVTNDKKTGDGKCQQLIFL